ncbi:response regulator transcription factor [Streptacidiphilus sp. 4-A2]|nr:response regulator transcription factor [Streptacidiphilus sp. 4-A2]
MSGAEDLLKHPPARHPGHAALVSEILSLVDGRAARSGGAQPLPSDHRLSPSELRVLRYLPTSLSRPEIAKALRVSTNTVSTHVRNIYAKLQATDRSSAVLRARELRLLGAEPAQLQS